MEIADSPISKMKGLMFRTLGENEGLLMTFDRKKRWKIWMLLVPQDLGLIFLDEERRVVDKVLAEKITVNPRTWKTHKPNERCNYIIECNPNILDEIEMGEKLSWDLA